MDPLPSFWAYFWPQSVDPNFSLSPTRLNFHNMDLWYHCTSKLDWFYYVFSWFMSFVHIIPWSNFPFHVIIVTGLYSVARQTQCNDSSLSDMQLLLSTRCLPVWIRRDSCRAGRWVVVTHAANRGRASLALDPLSLQCEWALHSPLHLLPSFVTALCLF